MRLFPVLCQQNYLNAFRRIWRKQGRMQAQELNIPTELQERGIHILDAKEILHETKIFPPVVEPVKCIPRPPSVYQQQKWFYLMHGETKISESENQALCLTKTIPYEGLPPSLSRLIGVDSLPNEDEVVQKCVLLSQVWNGDMQKLPKLFDADRPHWNFRRVYGTRYRRKVEGLMEKLTYVCDALIGKYPGCLYRDNVHRALCDLSIERIGQHVTFNQPAELLITASEPLKSFAADDLVNETKNMEVPNIYPIKPTLDLDKWEEMPPCSPMPRFNNRHIHTLFVLQKCTDFWSQREMLSQAIATSFAFCAKQAQMKYGLDVRELPEPISVQCVYADNRTFNFLAYQLNTLQLQDNEGIKNQVWIDGPHDLYERVSEDELITNYNPQVFPKIAAFYLNGLHPTSE